MGNEEILEGMGGLVAQTAELEDSHREVGGFNYSYIKIVGNSAQDPVKKPGKPEYIEGAEDGSFVIPSRKLHLGKQVDLTVLGMFLLYEDAIPGEQTEFQAREGQKPMPKVVDYWMPSDAEQVELEGVFDRPYMDKQGVRHTLRPVHWVFVHLHDHPDVQDAVITFRSTGNSVYKELQKMLKAEALTCTMVKLRMGTQEIKAKNWDKDYLYPSFGILGRNYHYNSETQAVSVAEGATALGVTALIKTSNAMQREYTSYRLVGKKGALAAKMQLGRPAVEAPAVLGGQKPAIAPPPAARKAVAVEETASTGADSANF